MPEPPTYEVTGLTGFGDRIQSDSVIGFTGLRIFHKVDQGVDVARVYHGLPYRLVSFK